jgi:hypothetical protein
VPVLPFPDENTLKRFEVGILKDSIAGYPLFTPSKMTSMASSPVNNPQDFGLRHHSQGSSVIGLTKEVNRTSLSVGPRINDPLLRYLI